MALPNKLFQLKKYLSIDDAAKLLTVSFGETITNKDILDLILDNHLPLCVKATHSKVKVILFSAHEPLANIHGNIKVYKSVADDEMIDDVRCGESFTSILKLKGHKDSIGNLRLNDYWLFPTIGGNRLAIENYKRKLSGQQLVDSFEGFIYLKDQNNYCKLYELKKEKELVTIINERLEYNINNYIPATEINGDLELFIEVAEIKKFELSLLDNKPKKDNPKTINAQAKFIKALIIANYGLGVANNVRWNINTENNNKNEVGKIRQHFQTKGLDQFLPEGKTVENWIKDIELDID